MTEPEPQWKPLGTRLPGFWHEQEVELGGYVASVGGHVSTPDGWKDDRWMWSVKSTKSAYVRAVNDVSGHADDEEKAKQAALAMLATCIYVKELYRGR